MKYSSHLYLRTDGTLGKYPIIETDKHNNIVHIEECGDTLRERQSTLFFAGVIVAGKASNETLHFNNKAEFINLMQGREIRLGDNSGLTLIEGFDLNTFNTATAKERQLTK